MDQLMRTTPLIFADLGQERYAEVWTNTQSVSEIDQRHRWRHDRGIESRPTIRHVHHNGEDCNPRCALLEPALRPALFAVDFLGLRGEVGN